SPGFSRISTERPASLPHSRIRNASCSVPTVIIVSPVTEKSPAAIWCHISSEKELISPIMIPIPRGTACVYAHRLFREQAAFLDAEGQERCVVVVRERGVPELAEHEGTDPRTAAAVDARLVRSRPPYPFDHVSEDAFARRVEVLYGRRHLCSKPEGEIFPDRSRPDHPVFLIDLAVHLLERIDQGNVRVPAEKRASDPSGALVEGDRDRVAVLIHEHPPLICVVACQQVRVQRIGERGKRGFDERDLVHFEDCRGLQFTPPTRYASRAGPRGSHRFWRLRAGRSPLRLHLREHGRPSSRTLSHCSQHSRGR